MKADDLKKVLADKCSKWIFQLERGEEKGYLHYQATFNLRVRKRRHEVAVLLGGRAHLTPISDNKAAWDYAKKTETRVEGPWSSELEDESEMPEDCKVVYEAPHDWQVSVVDILQKPYSSARARMVHIVIDPEGNNGKSTLVKYLRFHKVAGRILPADCKSMKRAAYDFWAKNKNKAWCIDLPRAERTQKFMAEVWAGIEGIKNAEYEDDRHVHKDAVVTTPNVVVFSNYDPIYTGCLSDDRIEKWIIYEKRLIQHTPARMEKVVAKAEAKVGQKRSRAIAHDPIDDE